MTLRLVIPANTSADVFLPGEIVTSNIAEKPEVQWHDGWCKVQVPAGQYEIQCKVTAGMRA